MHTCTPGITCKKKLAGEQKFGNMKCLTDHKLTNETRPRKTNLKQWQSYTNMNNIRIAICGVGSAYPSGAPKIKQFFGRVRIAQYWVFSDFFWVPLFLCVGVFFFLGHDVVSFFWQVMSLNIFDISPLFKKM